MPHLAHVALVVRDYDEALAFFVGRLCFDLIEDTCISTQDKRWVTIRPPGGRTGSTTILLDRASNERQEGYIGDQAGGRVFVFLATDDFVRDHAVFTAAGVEWVRPPTDHDYGRVAVWKDLYGNLWDLVEFAPGHPAAATRPVSRP